MEEYRVSFGVAILDNIPTIVVEAPLRMYEVYIYEV